MKLIVVMATLLTGLTAFAEGTSRIQAHFGLGQGTTVSADGRTTFIENPMAFGFTVDHPWTDAFFIYTEHLRSFGSAGTSMGFTGWGVKYYPWLSPIHAISEYRDTPEKTSISTNGYSTYFGGDVGFAQASISADSGHSAVVSVGPFLGFKTGVEYPFSKRWSLVSEFNFAMSLGGTGTMNFFSITFGTCYAL